MPEIIEIDKAGIPMRLDGIRKVEQSFIEQGYEGIVVKADVGYTRRWSWLKVKKLETADFVVLGINTKKKSWIERGEARSLLIGQYENGVLKPVCEATHPRSVNWHNPINNPLMTGDMQNGFLMVRPEIAVEVEFQETTQDGKLRHAIIKRLRTDKPATSCQGTAETKRGVRL